MEMIQIASLVNEIAKNVTGENTELLVEDLSNVVAVGTEIETAIGYDNFTKQLVDRIGRVIFVERGIEVDDLGIMKDNWEYGSILEKIAVEPVDAEDNPAWNLQNGDVVEQDKVTIPHLVVKFYNDDGTFEIPFTITDEQMRSAFTTPTQLGSFVGMIEQNVRNSVELRVKQYQRRAINNLIGLTIKDEAMDTGAATKSTVKVVNLLKLFKDNVNSSTTLTATTCIYDKEFIRFAVSEMDKYVGRLREATNLFNIGGKLRWTPKNRLKFILLDEFSSKANVYLQSDTFHNEFTRLPESGKIAFWQGTGDDFSFANTSKIDITTTNGDSIDVSGILGVMFDTDALGVNRYYEKTTAHRNEHGEFTNFWAKARMRLFNDTNENFVVFMVA